MRAVLVLAVCCVLAFAASLPPTSSGVHFADITSAAGIHFVHNAGKTGKKFLPETLGSGAAFIDADGDGWIDIFLVNSRDWTPGGKKTTGALYRNNKNGTFTDITAGSGLDVEMYGIGVAVGDFDNDGRDDLYITSLDGDRLFHNEGNFKFRDVTKASGIDNAVFGTSAAWLDYDRDGKLDLFVANYVQWNQKSDLWCSLDGATKSYCTPESYKGTQSRLYHNLGNGRFEDVTAKAGLTDPTSKSLGISVIDYDCDGWPDLFVANDTQPNKLYHNNHNGTFKEVGMQAGVAFGEDGIAKGAMGTDSIDYDRSGRPALLVGNFTNQMLALYHNEGNGLFVMKRRSRLSGRKVFSRYRSASSSSITISMATRISSPPTAILRNRSIASSRRSNTKSRRCCSTMSTASDLKTSRRRSAIRSPFLMVARGAIYGDIDHDGDLDVLFSRRTQVRRVYCGTTAAIGITGSVSERPAPNRIAMESARW